MIRDVLLAALGARFDADAFRAGARPEPVAVFPARHAEVGDAVLWLESGPSQGSDVQIQIGRILHDDFHSYDTHLEPAERAARVTIAFYVGATTLVGLVLGLVLAATALLALHIGTWASGRQPA